ncbi:MAG: adenylate/guanylate cyclase domain-containing protein, partial [Thermoflexales bacterium]
MTSNFPAGTVTFLFTDIEGSTRMWELYPGPMKAALARHDALLQDIVRRHTGSVIKTTGDGLHAVFAQASDGVAATLAAQLALRDEAWPGLPGPLRVQGRGHAIGRLAEDRVQAIAGCL